MSVLAELTRLVERLAELLHPFFGASATAAAIVLFTALVRLAIHPLSRAAARGRRATARLAPRAAALRTRHARDPERLRRALTELYAKEGVSPVGGCLPALFQLPAFLLLYVLFGRESLGGEPNPLLGHTLLTAPLGGRWGDALADGGLFGGAGPVYLALFGLTAAVAVVSFRLTRKQAASAPVPVTDPSAPGAGAMAAMTRVAPFLAFGTLITVAVLPLAAALYILTSTAWATAERALLEREPAPAERPSRPRPARAKR
jgi:YidC/Oxa1 family membrane protein insertase